MKEKKTISAKSRLKSIIALAMCTFMVFSITGCSSGNKETSSDDTGKGVGDVNAGKNSTVPDYLNTGGKLPIVKEGNKKDLTMAVSMDVNAGKPEEMWAYKFMKETMNINVKINSFTPKNRAEFISLMFASDGLPDVIIGTGLTANELMTYGGREGQLMDLAPYVNETYMPYLSAIYKEHPEWKNVVMESKGHVYSLGYINEPSDQGQIPRLFYNYDWIDKLKLKVPSTLNEFIDMLRAFKAQGNNIIPIGGSYKTVNATIGVLNAFGYNTNDAKGTSIALRDNKVVLPVADREAYGEYLKVMNTLYKEGIIDKDFYTVDDTKMQAYISEGRTGVIAQAPFVYTKDYTQWWGAKPLTSEYNNKAFWPSSTTAITAGQLVVSSKCKNPELVAVFADWFFDPDSKNYSLFTNGAPSVDNKNLYGTLGWKIDDTTRVRTYTDYENNKSVYSSVNQYLAQKVQLFPYRVLGYGYWSSVGTWSYQLLAGYSKDQAKTGWPDLKAYNGNKPIRQTFTDGETHFRMALKDTLVDYVVPGYPSNVYFDADTSTDVANLTTVINEYAERESAKFVTGARSLSELNTYFDEIERLGAKKLVKFYADYYTALNSK